MFNIPKDAAYMCECVCVYHVIITYLQKEMNNL